MEEPIPCPLDLYFRAQHDPFRLLALTAHLLLDHALETVALHTATQFTAAQIGCRRLQSNRRPAKRVVDEIHTT